MSPNKISKQDQDDRRRARRRPLVESFSCFVSIPKRGSHRLHVYDLSELGVGFDFDIEGEDLGAHPLALDDLLELHFYINQSLFLPLKIRVARIEDKKTKRKVGAEFTEPKSDSCRALQAFLKMIDEIFEAAHFQSTKS